MKVEEKILDSLNKFKSNPLNTHIINGSSNTIIKGNQNKIEVNNYSEKPKIKVIKEEYQYDKEIHISAREQMIIKGVVVEIGDMCRDCLDEGKWAYVYKKLYNKFNVPKYTLILKEDFKKAKKYLDSEKMMLLSKIRVYDISRYKKYMIPKLKELWNIKEEAIIKKYGCYSLLEFSIFVAKKK